MLLPRRLWRPGTLAFCNSHTCRLLLGFAFLYVLAIELARRTCWRDPTSAFFAEDKAYQPVYSVQRTEKAVALLEHANDNTLPLHFQLKASAHPTLCVEIASVARKVVSYLHGTAAIRHWRPVTTAYLPNETIALLSLVLTPPLTVLFFAAGRVTMLPMPKGVHVMSKFGCCSQGRVFPQARIGDLVPWYESNRFGYVDMLTEKYAD